MCVDKKIQGSEKHGTGKNHRAADAGSGTSAGGSLLPGQFGLSDQLHSYAAQIRNYTEEIARHDGWELVECMPTKGLTGTWMDQRDDFNRMMRDCRKGKIDRILVKSVSRFARNTRDCLSALRELSAMGVSVRFKEKNIDTKTLTTELMVSVSGSLAQQESISISANQKMSYQRRMERGGNLSPAPPLTDTES